VSEEDRKPADPAADEAPDEGSTPVSDSVDSSPTSSDPDEDLQSARASLEAQLEAAQKEANDIKERWLRSAADLENFRKRAAKEREEVQKFGNERLLRDFLPIYDDLERALNAAGGAEGEAVEQLRGGVDMVRKKFLQQLERHGVEGFSSVGEAFDPVKHEAIQQAHSNEVEAGRILDELQRGFMLQGRLLRPSMVVVSLGPEAAEA